MHRSVGSCSVLRNTQIFFIVSRAFNIFWQSYHFIHMCNSVYLNVKKSVARNACFNDITLTCDCKVDDSALNIYVYFVTSDVICQLLYINTFHILFQKHLHFTVASSFNSV